MSRKKVVDIQNRIPHVKRKRKKRKKHRLYLLLFALFVIGSLLLYFNTEYSDIARFEVKGAHLIEPEKYVLDSGLMIGDSLWGFQPKKVKERIIVDEVVKDVDVYRSFNRTVTIEVDEWEPLAYIEEKDAFYLLLNNGHQLDTVEKLPKKKLPILTNFSKKDKKALKVVTQQLEDLDHSVSELISEIVYNNANNEKKVTLYMDDGYEVRGYLRNFAATLKYYPDMVAQLQEDEKGVIDIEVEKGAFFTPYSQIYGEGEERNEGEERAIENLEEVEDESVFEDE